MSSPDNPETTFKSVLQEIYFEYGEEVLRNGHRLYSIFSDMAPQLQKEKRVLKSFLECSGNTRILDAKGKPLAEQKNVIEAIVYKMHEELSIPESAAQSTCNDFYSVVNAGRTIEFLRRPEEGEKPKVQNPVSDKGRETVKESTSQPVKWPIICGVLLIIIDQFTRFFAYQILNWSQPSNELIPDFISLVKIWDDVYAFSLTARITAIVFSLVFIVLGIGILRKNIVSGKFGRWCLILVMSGVFSNLIDRVSLGYVRDTFCLDNVDYTVFNLADAFIVICSFLFILNVVTNSYNGRRVLGLLIILTLAIAFLDLNLSTLLLFYVIGIVLLPYLYEFIKKLLK